MLAVERDYVKGKEHPEGVHAGGRPNPQTGIRIQPPSAQQSNQAHKERIGQPSKQFGIQREIHGLPLDAQRVSTSRAITSR